MRLPVHSLAYLVRPALLVAIVAAASCAAHAQVTSYSSLSTYRAAATTTAGYGFESLTLPQGVYVNPSLTPLSVSISDGSDYTIRTIAFGYSLNGSATLVGAFNPSATPTATTTTIGFGSDVTAFGTEFGFRLGNVRPTGTVSVQLFSGTTPVGNAQGFTVAQTGTFVGFTSTQAFNNATFTSTSQTSDARQAFDNVRLGSVISAAAPEPPTLPLVGLGFMGCSATIGMVRHKAKKRDT